MDSSSVVTTTSTPMSTSTLTASPPPRLRLYLVICNIQKLQNVKALMNTAFAFGCAEVIVVGQENNKNKKNSRQRTQEWIPRGFQQAMDQHKIRLTQCAKWKECLDYLQTHQILLVGVEIDESSVVLDDSFEPPGVAASASACQNLAVFMGNEGQGIHPKHLKACDSLIRIPQYGRGTASFNVNVACSIVLYQLQKWKQTRSTQPDSSTVIPEEG
jgi:tRNA G18 (ribose-2'-O)-methylase SpoU